MAAFDVYPNPNPSAARGLPYVLEIQSNLFGNLPTAVVIPLALPDVIDHTPVLRLNPMVVVGEQELLVMTQELAAISRRKLTAPVIQLSSAREAVLAALDLLFVGF